MRQSYSALTALIPLLLSLALAGCQSGGAPKPAAQATPAPAAPQTPTINSVAVQSLELNRTVRLPGELLPWQEATLSAKIASFVETITVDRGSVVRKGQLLARLRAPELDTQRNEAEAHVRTATAQRLEAEARIGSIRAQRLEAAAKLAASETTHQRLKAASATPGAVAGHDVEIALRGVEADKARVQLWRENEKAAEAQVKAIGENEGALREATGSARNMEAYLRITAPFDGMITERNAHPGALASPAGAPLFRLQQVARLRLVLALPEAEISGIRRGGRITFTVPAFPDEVFTAIVSRNGRALDTKTRTMPLELDVVNNGGRLAPGMFPEIIWPARRAAISLFVPPAAVAVTTERIFVIRLRDGVAEWVDVKRGASMNHQGADMVEVFGALAAGDQIAARGTDELRAGTKVIVKTAK
ncbi:MAG: efflux RND transporter periplasmic adaptor subunit [Blastocatellia bacterium]